MGMLPNAGYYSVSTISGGTFTQGAGLNWSTQFATQSEWGVPTIGGELILFPDSASSHSPTGAAGGDLTGTYPNPTLVAITAAATVGDATHVARVTFDAKGRITAASAVAISGAGIDTTAVHSGDAANGDLGGTYPNPIIEYGLASTSSTGAITTTVTIVTSSGATTQTLPTPVGKTGQIRIVKNADGTTGVVTLATAAGNIDGGATASILALASLTVVSDGSNWWIV